MRFLLVAVAFVGLSLSTTSAFADEPTTKIDPSAVMAVGGLALAATAFAVRVSVFHPDASGHISAGGIGWRASAPWYVPGLGGAFYGVGAMVGGMLPDSGHPFVPGLAIFSLGLAEGAGLALVMAGIVRSTRTVRPYATAQSAGVTGIW